MRLLDGKRIADSILLRLKKEVAGLKKKPGLAVVLVGNDPASELYVKLKAKAAKRIGIKFKLFKFSDKVSQKTILNTINKLNGDGQIDGIIVQLPLPHKLNTPKIIKAIDPKKDVDGFQPQNLRSFLHGESGIFPVFPLAITTLVESSGHKLKNKRGIIIANSKEFGSTMIEALRRINVRAEYILSKKVNKNVNLIKKADIIVSAIGKSEAISGNMLKKGAIVIDGGISKTETGVVGDVDFVSAKKVAGFISPVPGGVGPVTIACLLQNVASLAKNKVEAVIFDMDGVVSDTEMFHAKIESKILKKFGVVMSPEEIADKFSGVPTINSLHEVLKGKKLDFERIAEIKQRTVLKNARGHIRPIPGILGLIEKLTKKGIKIALGTSSQRKMADLILKELRMKKFFKTVISIENVKNGKPDPEVFLLAAKKLGVKPCNCIVIEDGRNGMLAAKAAGMKCIGLVKNREDKSFPADILVEKLKEIEI